MFRYYELLRYETFFEPNALNIFYGRSKIGDKANELKNTIKTWQENVHYPLSFKEENATVKPVLKSGYCLRK